MNKKVLSILLIFVMSFVCMNVRALQFSLTITPNGTVNADQDIVSGTGADDPIYFSYKYTNISGTKYLVFCTGNRELPILQGVNEYKTNNNFSPYVRAGIAQIIIEGVGENATTTNYSLTSSDLYTTQIAIWMYLYEKGLYNGDSLMYTYNSLKENANGLYNRVNNLVEYATDAEINAKEIDDSFSPRLSEDVLIFTKEGDNYVSNNVKVRDDYIDTVTVSAPSYVSVQGNNTSGYVFTVPASKLSAKKTELSIEFDIKSTSQKIVNNYSTGNDTLYQTVTYTQLDSMSNSRTLDIEGLIEVVPKLTIEKVDANGNYLDGATVKITRNGNDFKELTVNGGKVDITENLTFDDEYCVKEVKSPDGYILSEKPSCTTLTYARPEGTITITNVKTKIIINKLSDDEKENLEGATLKLTDKDGNTVKYCKDSDGNSIECTWETTKDSYIIEGLPIGVYYLEEVSAPTGYKLSDEKIKIEIKEKGVININDEVSSDGIINFKNSLNKIVISKKDATSSKELPGATLEILDSNKKSMSCIIIDDDGKEKELDKCTWVSGKKPKTIVGLSKGTYYLVETIAPKGYNLLSNKIKLEISEKGVVSVDGKESSNGQVNIKNSLTKTIISKISAASSKELPGATLEILDSNQKNISCIILDENGKEKKLDKCTWVSGEKPKTIVGLSKGTYYLVETIAPKGFVLNTNKIEFKVKANGEVTKVEMQNELEVEVPDTLSTRSSLFITISSVLIFLGLSIILSRKTKKINL